MFLVGLDLDPARLRGHSHVTIVTSHAGIVAPFVLGTFLALYLYPRYSTRDVPFLAFALFCGRVLVGHRLSRARPHPGRASASSRRGSARWPSPVRRWTTRPLGCSWPRLTSVTRADATSALRTLGLTIAYVALMLGLARPRMERLVRAFDRRGGLTAGVISVAFLAMLASALVTEWIGIHALFGAFLLGVVTPHDSASPRSCARSSRTSW